MALNASNVPETELRTSGELGTVRCYVDDTGLHVTKMGGAAPLFAVDASGNVSFPGTSTPSSYVLRTVEDGITAGTTQTQGGAYALTKDFSRVATCANDNDGVKLPAAVVGRTVEVVNDGAQLLKVWPATGDDLGAGANTATTQATTVGNRYVCYASAKWRKL